MMKPLLALSLVLAASIRLAVAQAQPGDCEVSGHLYFSDGTPAANAAVTIVRVERNDQVIVNSPTTITADPNGFVDFIVPRNSSAWVQANKITGLNKLGGVPLQIPDAPTAAVEALWHLRDGVFTFNGRRGDITLSSADVTSALGYVPVGPSSGLFQAPVFAPAFYGGSDPSSTLVLSGTSNPSSSTKSNIIMNGANQGSVLIGTAVDQPANLAVQGVNSSAPNGTTAVSIAKGERASSALDIHTTDNGQAVRFFTTNPAGQGQPRTYFNTEGALFTNAWVNISGTTHGSGDGYGIDFPSTDSSMLTVWSDVNGPALQVRGSNGTVHGSYLFSGLDNSGNHTFFIEEDGALQWSTSTRAAIDTRLYRAGPGMLRTDGRFGLGTTPLADLHVASANASFRLQNTSAGGKTMDMFVGTGGIGVGTPSAPQQLLIYSGTPTNAMVVGDNSGARLTIGLPEGIGSKGGMDLNLKSDQFGTAGKAVSVQGWNGATWQRAVTVANKSAGNVDVQLVPEGGNVIAGVGTAAPDAVLDVNGGNTKGLRIRPRTTRGAPATGTWSTGTIILDLDSVLYICTSGGTPGSWQKIGAQ